MSRRDPGGAARRARGWWATQRWLLARRACQFGLLALFLAGPLAGVWIVKGNLSFSETLGVLPLQDPLVLLQSLLAGHAPAAAAWTGLVIVLAGYLLVGGRSYCAWVCPINPVTDAAAWLRRKLDLRRTPRLSPRLRLAVLAGVLAAAALGGSLAWELLNPVTAVHRALVFGMGSAWMLLLAIFVFDLLMVDAGWCGHLCPAGALWGLLGKASLLKLQAAGRERCDDCGDCYVVCPEPQVIKPALKTASGPMVRDSACTHCARCLDVCAHDVFQWGTRFASAPASQPTLPLAEAKEKP